MTQQRIITWTILLSLPIVVLLGWFVTERAPAWFPTVPGWLRPTSANPALGACEALAAVDAYGGEFINFAEPTTLMPQDATARAREHVQATIDVGPDAAISLSRPTLVRATFPDAGERLAWLIIATLPKDAGARYDRSGSPQAVADQVTSSQGDIDALFGG